MAQGETTGRDVHPNDDLLLALHDGVLFSGDRPRVEAHVKGCARCRARLTALTEDITPSVTAPPAAATRPDSARSSSTIRRLVTAVVVLGILAGTGIVVRRQLMRRNLELETLAVTPTAPVSPPTPAVSAAPVTPALEPAAPTIDAAIIEPDSANTNTPASPVPSPAPVAAPVPSSAPTVEPLVISSPNRNFRWRVTGLAVERTTNGGADWRKQAIALTRPITAGTAPSAAVCWLVGRGGSVFVAIGAEWKSVSLTESVDLVRVAAIDSMNATVTATDGRQFSTSDAGVSWNLLQP